MKDETRSFVERAKERWQGMSPLEKVGTAAIATVAGTAAVVGTAMFVAPSLSAATAGGALTAAGVYLLNQGFRS